MHIKSILTSEERFVLSDLVNHVATGSPQTNGPMCGLMASPSGPPLFMLGTRPAGP